MKRTLIEPLISLLLFYLIACAAAAVITFGIILMPLLVISLFVLAVREIMIWSKKPKNRKQINVPQPSKTTIVKPIPIHTPYSKAA